MHAEFREFFQGPLTTDEYVRQKGWDVVDIDYTGDVEDLIIDKDDDCFICRAPSSEHTRGMAVNEMTYGNTLVRMPIPSIKCNSCGVIWTYEEMSEPLKSLLFIDEVE